MNDRFHVSIGLDLAALEEDSPQAETSRELHVVTHEQNCPPFQRDVSHAPEAALLKFGVAYG